MSQPAGEPTATPAASPTPNSMPGAQPQTQQGTPTATQQPEKTADQPTTPAPEAKPAETKSPEAATVPQTLDEALVELERLKAVRTEERIWEKRAKANKAAADELAALKEAQKPQEQRDKEERDRILSENAELKADKLRNKVSRDTGVPAELLAGSTEEELVASAEVANKWRGPQAQSSAVPASVVTSSGKVEGAAQLSQAELAKMSPAQIMDAYRNGQLTNIGAIPGQGDLRNLQHAKAAAQQGK